MLLDISIEISIWELVLLLSSFLYVVHHVLICWLIVSGLLGIRGSLVIDANLGCVIKGTQLTFCNFSFLFIRCPLYNLIVLCRIKTFLIWLAKLRRNFATLSTTHCRIVARRLLNRDPWWYDLMRLTWSSGRSFRLIGYTHETVVFGTILHNILPWPSSSSLRTQSYSIVKRLCLEHAIYRLLAAHHWCLSWYFEVLGSLFLVL